MFRVVETVIIEDPSDNSLKARYFHSFPHTGFEHFPKLDLLCTALARVYFNHPAVGTRRDFD